MEREIASAIQYYQLMLNEINSILNSANAINKFLQLEQ